MDERKTVEARLARLERMERELEEELAICQAKGLTLLAEEVDVALRRIRGIIGAFRYALSPPEERSAKVLDCVDRVVTKMHKKGWVR
jgi:hypothetical protein